MILALWLLLGYGCFGWGSGDSSDGGCGGDDAEVVDVCGQPYTGASLDGRWELHATGTRTDCSERRLEGKLEIDTTLPLNVDAEAQETIGDRPSPMPESEADAFVQRIERADFELSAEELPRSVTFSGAVRGSCVQLTLTERLPNGDTLRYELDGHIDYRGRLSGTFIGTGPEQCQSDGTFTATVQ